MFWLFFQALISSCVHLMKNAIILHCTKYFCLFVCFLRKTSLVFQTGSKSGKWRPPWTKTKHKLWVYFHQSALRAHMHPKALAQTTNLHFSVIPVWSFYSVFSVWQLIKPVMFLFVFLSRTCFLLRSLHIETSPSPTQLRSTSLSLMGRRSAVSLSTSCIHLWSVCAQWLCHIWSNAQTLSLTIVRKSIFI